MKALKRKRKVGGIQRQIAMQRTQRKKSNQRLQFPPMKTRGSIKAVLFWNQVGSKRQKRKTSVTKIRNLSNYELVTDLGTLHPNRLRRSRWPAEERSGRVCAVYMVYMDHGLYETTLLICVVGRWILSLLLLSRKISLKWPRSRVGLALFGEGDCVLAPAREWVGI